MKVKSMSALGNYHCSSMCQASPCVRGEGLLWREKKETGPHTNKHNWSASDLDWSHQPENRESTSRITGRQRQHGSIKYLARKQR